jgi:putative Ca2+/H+ antiporter (TMEM165/GDT1 family)
MVRLTSPRWFGKTFDIDASAHGWGGWRVYHRYFAPSNTIIMEAFLVSMLAIAVGEIGDKTQLLALLLAARYRQPLPIILGILTATLANHALAAMLGIWVAAHIPAHILTWALGLSFLAIALWTLKPDSMDDTEIQQGRWGVFAVTCVTFFLAEIGDKTQLATVALAAKYTHLFPVLAGTTLGMLLADVPAVFLGKVAAPNFPFVWVRRIAAAIFAVLGALVLLSLSPAFSELL